MEHVIRPIHLDRCFFILSFGYDFLPVDEEHKTCVILVYIFHTKRHALIVKGLGSGSGCVI